MGDTTSEANETFTVTLSNPSAGLTLGDAVATGTITNDDVTITKISTVQGTAAASTLVGQTVTVPAIVVGDFQNGDGDTLRNLDGFFLQEENADWDANALTSEGVFVFQNGLAGAVTIGDRVQVTGSVGESFGQTRITLTSVSVLGSGAVGDVRTLAVGLTLPEAGVTGGGTNPDLERYAGMIVRFPQTLTINEMFNLDRFNEITLVAGERPFQFTHDNAPNQAGNTAQLERVRSRTITYDDGEGAQNRPIGNLDGDDRRRSPHPRRPQQLFPRGAHHLSGGGRLREPAAPSGRPLFLCFRRPTRLARLHPEQCESQRPGRIGGRVAPQRG